jgi:hypothetical protein
VYFEGSDRCRIADLLALIHFLAYKLRQKLPTNFMTPVPVGHQLYQHGATQSLMLCWGSYIGIRYQYIDPILVRG